MSAPSQAEQQSPWLFSPLVDLLFLANVIWLIGLIPWMVSDQGTVPVTFWQVYFITTPHRWITLLIVATDPDRRVGRNSWFVAITVTAVLVVGGTYFWTSGLGCLLVIDYIWNAWHFGAQHGGILRMYARKAGGGRPRLETLTIRTVVVYTALRLAGWTTGWIEAHADWLTLLNVVDGVMIGLLVYLFVSDLRANAWQKRAKLSYLASVSALYCAVLLSVIWGIPWLIITLTIGQAWFHSVEYMAVVTYYAERRKEHGSPAPFQTLARYWGKLLTLFMLAVGSFAVMAELHMEDTWLAINVCVAYLHYAYDGLIWKLRKPDTAKILAVEISGGAAGG